MTMSYNNFVEYAVSLKNHSDTIDDGWAMCEHTNALDNTVIKYLVKKEMMKRTQHLLKSDDSEFKLTDDAHIMCEYHILYNLSYSCPDLYFNMWHMNGKLLSLKHIWSLVHSSLKETLIADKWNALTQKEHPLKNVPFFTLHPCRTTHIMELLGFSEKKYTEGNPLVAWLSTISPLVGLDMHLSYGILCKLSSSIPLNIVMTF